MAVTLSFYASELGMGCSTLAVNLGTEFMRRGRRVRILDMDPQHQASKWAEGAANLDKLHVLLKEVNQEVLTNIEESRKMIEDTCNWADIVILDTSCEEEALRKSNLKISSVVLIPWSDFSEKGVENLVKTYREAVDFALPNSQIQIVPNRISADEDIGEALQAVANEISVRTLPVIHSDPMIPEAIGKKQTIREYDRKCNATKEYEALAYQIEFNLD